MAGAKRAKIVDRGEGAAGGDSEKRATMVAALGCGGAIEVAVAGQQQGTLGFGAIASREAVQQGIAAARSDAEHRPVSVGAARRGYPVEVAIVAQRKPGIGSVAIGTVGLGAKAVQDRHRAARGHLEHDAAVVRPRSVGCAIEIAVGALHEGLIEGLGSVRVVEIDQRGQSLCRGGDGYRGAKRKEREGYSR